MGNLVHLQIHLAKMWSVNRRKEFMEMQKVCVCTHTYTKADVHIHINIMGSIHFTSAAHTS